VIFRSAQLNGSTGKLNKFSEVGLSKDADIVSLPDQLFNLSMLAAFAVSGQMPNVLIADDQ
jgi:hypothetical protein